MKNGTVRNRVVFATLFERHVEAVFAAAWLVVRSRSLAADITRATFVDAWGDVDHLPAETADLWLVAQARERAYQWLQANDRHRLPPATAETARQAVLNPVLRARVVAGLELAGIPTRPEEVRAVPEPQGQRVRRSRGRELAIVAGAAALVASVILALRPGSDPDTGTTSALINPSTSPSTPTSTSASASTTTTVPGPLPIIESLSGVWLADRTCPPGTNRLTLTWAAPGSTSVRIKPDGGAWLDVPAPSGEHKTCIDSGIRWYLEATNPSGTITHNIRLGH